MMIIVGIENCKSCKIAKKFLPDIPYVELKKGSFGDVKILKIKRALTKLNTSQQLPVILNDSLDKIVDTSTLLKNLNSVKIINIIQNQ